MAIAPAIWALLQSDKGDKKQQDERKLARRLQRQRNDQIAQLPAIERSRLLGTSAIGDSGGPLTGGGAM